jgi:hypothetical protein
VSNSRKTKPLDEVKKHMMDRSLKVLLAAVLLATAACSRTNKVEQLAALDSAYQSGLLTKDEYDTKRFALAGTAPVPAVAPNPVPAAPATTSAPDPNTVPAAATPATTSAPDPNTVPAAATPATTSAPGPDTVPAAATPAPAPAPVANPAPTAAPAPKVIQPPAQPVPTSPAPSASTARSAPASGADANEPEPAPAAGCEDEEYKSGGKKGVQDRFFAAPPDVVKRAAVSALGSLDFTIHKNSNDEIEASKNRHIGVVVGAGGERMILTFKRTQRGTRVSGETKKRFIGHLTQKTWTSAVLAQIACKLREASR